MILENKGEALTITYDGKDYPLPAGKFEVSDELLGNHIIVTAKKWEGVNIVIIDKNVVRDIKPAIEPQVEAPTPLEVNIDKVNEALTNEDTGSDTSEPEIDPDMILEE